MVQHQAISEKEPIRHSHFNRYESKINPQRITFRKKDVLVLIIVKSLINTIIILNNNLLIENIL